MNWKEHWDKAALEQDPYQQVARVGGKGKMGERVLLETAQRIANVLQIQKTDHILDVCCGNGLLTALLLPYCERITAVDISAGQIKLARKRQIDHIDFQVADASKLSATVNASFDHIVLYFSFQYLESKSQATASLRQMSSLLKEGGKILLGDVPEREKLNVFYPKPLDRLKYHLKVRWGRSLMGRFWSLHELQSMAQALDLSITRLEQPPEFPYAHYRADFVLEKAAI